MPKRMLDGSAYYVIGSYETTDLDAVQLRAIRATDAGGYLDSLQRLIDRAPSVSARIEAEETCQAAFLAAWLATGGNSNVGHRLAADFSQRLFAFGGL